MGAELCDGLEGIGRERILRALNNVAHVRRGQLRAAEVVLAVLDGSETDESFRLLYFAPIGADRGLETWKEEIHRLFSPDLGGVFDLEAGQVIGLLCGGAAFRPGRHEAEHADQPQGDQKPRRAISTRDRELHTDLL